MCLAIPGRVIDVEVNDEGVRVARTNFGGVVKQVCLEYTPEAKPGDYVLVHVGVALGIVDEAEAAKTYRILAELGQLEELEPPDLEQLAAARKGSHEIPR